MIKLRAPSLGETGGVGVSQIYDLIAWNIKVEKNLV